MADEYFCQFFRRFRREEGGMRIGKFRCLLLDRLDHARMLMAETGHRRATGRIENFAAVLGKQPDALAADGFWRGLSQAPVHHAASVSGHDGQPFSATYWDISASRASVCSSRRFAPAPPSVNVTAASDCAIAIAPVRLGKKPGDAAASNSSK